MPSDLVEKLNDIWRDDDHERGCEGRNYTCSCGFDERTYETGRLAAEAIAAKDAELAKLRDHMKLIAQGYLSEVRDDRYIVIENPEFQPDDGTNPFVVIDVMAGASDA